MFSLLTACCYPSEAAVVRPVPRTPILPQDLFQHAIAEMQLEERPAVGQQAQVPSEGGLYSASAATERVISEPFQKIIAESHKRLWHTNEEDYKVEIVRDQLLTVLEEAFQSDEYPNKSVIYNRAFAVNKMSLDMVKQQQKSLEREISFHRASLLESPSDSLFERDEYRPQHTEQAHPLSFPYKKKQRLNSNDEKELEAILRRSSLDIEEERSHVDVEEEKRPTHEEEKKHDEDLALI
jgi:hypothetical protein